MRKYFQNRRGLVATLALTLCAALGGHAQSPTWRMPNQPAPAFDCFPAAYVGAPNSIQGNSGTSQLNTGYNPNGF